jgi:GNAT superfamily N-acetyltransferase
MDELKITGYRPGAIGKITELHATYYHEQWGFGLFFERKVAADMAEFLGQFDEIRDGFWIAWRQNEIVGCIAIDGRQATHEGAHLRWFIVAPRWHGEGIGEALLEKAVDFCKDRAFSRVSLWTFSGLDAARHLYEKQGFVLRKEVESDQWGTTVTAQQFERLLS